MAHTPQSTQLDESEAVLKAMEDQFAKELTAAQQKLDEALLTALDSRRQAESAQKELAEERNLTQELRKSVGLPPE